MTNALLCSNIIQKAKYLLLESYTIEINDLKGRKTHYIGICFHECACNSAAISKENNFHSSTYID